MRLSLLKKLTLNHYTIAGAGIFAVIVLHFVFQFAFIQSENFRSALVSIQPEPMRGKSLEIKIEDNASKSDKNINNINEEASKMEIGVSTKTAAPQQPKIVPSKTVEKKKEPRENRAERLRRVEKILTGV